MIKFAIAADRLKTNFVDITEFADTFDIIVFDIIAVIDKLDSNNFNNFNIDYENFDNQQAYIATKNRIEKNADNYRSDSRRRTYSRKHNYDISRYY